MNIHKLFEQINKIEKISHDCDKTLKKIEINKNKNIFKNTYLENKESIIELYKLFIFYGLLEYSVNYVLDKNLR
tara:strand:- start:1002 stop:1223 length:222 start_codon:yes stop_codon:yes gene_type:complete